MQTNSKEYYEPINIFRQPAIHVKKRDEFKNVTKPYSYGKTWQNNIKKLDYSNLRKVSDDYNDYYTTKKLKSDYWKFERLLNDTEDSCSNSTIPIDISINGNSDKFAIANSNNSKNLTLFQLNHDDTEQEKLNKLQTVTIPSTPITQVSFVNSYSAKPQEDIILTGHQNGYVNLIKSTSESSQIVKRFNHSKFMTFTNNDNFTSTNIEPYLGKVSMPIKQLTANSSNTNSFISLINESLFIYDFDSNKSPTYLNHIPDINSFTAPCQDKNLITLNLNTGISFLDVRNSNSPDIYNIGNRITTSEWLDEYTIATGSNNAQEIKIFDMRMFSSENTMDISEVIIPFSSCILNSENHNSHVKSLKYDSFNQKLDCLDGFGNLSVWDLTTPSSKRVLKNGLNSIKLKDNLENSLECGDLIVRDGDITQIELWQGGVIGLGLHEIGLHRIVDVRETLTKDRTIEPIMETNESTDNISIDSDGTSIFDAHTFDELLDNSTVMLPIMSPIKPVEPLHPYSLANLSSQTMVDVSDI